MKATVSKKEFKAWLETKTSSAQVGVPSDGEKCPLAKYFQSINGIKPGQVEVGGEIVIYDKDGLHSKAASSKPWMVKFMDGVDKIDGTRISAKKALDILATC